MSELFDDEDLEQSAELNEPTQDADHSKSSEARKRLEQLLAEKKLNDELEDFFDEE